MLITRTPVQIERIVHGKIRAVARERIGKAGGLRGGEKLNANLGLSSLDLAFLVAELDAQLGVDPFAKLFSITSVRTVDDIVQAYQQAMFPKLQRAGKTDALAPAVERAATRRARRERR